MPERSREGCGGRPHREQPGEHSGRGAQAWAGFGRRMFVAGLFFLGFVTLTIVGIVFAVAWVIDRLTSLPLAVLVPIGLVVMVIFTLRRLARTWLPVRGIIRAAGALADGDYSARVPPGGSPAVRRVVDSFNDMARRLETADEQRRRLLADVGHELRTPLTVVRGEIEAMLDGVHQPDAEHLELLAAEVEVMERLLEDLRTLSLIDAGSLALHPEPTDVDRLVEDVADLHRRRAAEAGITVEMVLGPVTRELDIDPVRIREVLSNLVVNSLRAMPDGGRLRITTRVVENGAVITVADTGTGIAPQDLALVFERFHKGSDSAGSGLGLTISRDLVAAHGGTLTIESEVGVGTVATVDLSPTAADTDTQ